jgi:hypothetical protein
MIAPAKIAWYLALLIFCALSWWGAYSAVVYGLNKLRGN